MMSCALLEIGIIDSDCVDVLVPRAAPAKTSVAIFDGPGTSEAGVVAVLDSHPDIFVAHVGPGDIRAAVLGQFDVVLFPGGSGGQQGRAIGSRGREILRQYVRQGGGVVGICAGAYLCSSHYDWALHLMNATVYNTMIEIPGVGRKSMWYRGHSTEVDVEVVGPGSDILGVHGVHSIRYHNGPILSPGNDPDSPPFVVLAVFRSENHLYDVQKDTMVNTPAVVSTQFGTGRVLAFSPHFESTDGYRQVIVRGIQYVRRAGSHAE